MQNEAGASPRPAKPETATQVVHAALSAFEDESGLTPLVILLPTRIFRQYEREAMSLAAVLPPEPEGARGPEWCDVRVVEHESNEEIEVY